LTACRLGLVLVALCLVLFFLQLGRRPLWDSDEGIHASTSQTMVETGDWLVPKFNGTNFYDKPPLHTWFVAASLAVLGKSEFAARLPAALLGLGCVLLTFWLGRRMFGTTAAFFGAVVLATNVLFIAISRNVVHDISLTFFVTASLALFWEGYTSEHHRRRNFLLFWLCLALGTVAKGPLGIAIPGIPIAFVLVWQRQLRFIGKMQLALGLPLFAIIALPWYVAMAITQDDYVESFLIGKLLGSVASEHARHNEPLYFYLPIFAAVFLPWTLFLPGVFIEAARSRKREHGAAVVFLLAWFLGGFVFFSAMTSKLITYLLPLVPALSLLSGWMWQQVIAGTSPARRWVDYTYRAIAAAVFIAAIGVWIVPTPPRLAETGLSMDTFATAGIGAAVICAGGLWALARQRYVGVFGSIVAVVVLGVVFFINVVSPIVSPSRTTKTLAAVIDTLLPAGEDIVFLIDFKNSAFFYTARKGRRLMSAPEVKDYFDSPERVFALSKAEHMPMLSPWSDNLHIVREEGGEVLLSNRGDPIDAPAKNRH